MQQASLTIGRLARAASVNIETVLLPGAQPVGGPESAGRRMRESLSRLIDACHRTRSDEPRPIIEAPVPGRAAAPN
jgi:hypothetical protein